MAPRPHWKGYLKLSLVSCPVALYPAINASERLSFRQVNKTTGNRLRHHLVDSVTGEAVQSHDKGRGYEIGENQFVVVKDEELETARQEARTRPYTADTRQFEAQDLPQAPPARGRAKREHRAEIEKQLPAPELPPVRIENPRTIEIERFVPSTQLDAAYFNTPYFITPRDELGQEAFAVIRDAMASKGVVGMGRVVLANRERPFLVEPMGKGLRGITLRYAHELRSVADYFSDIPELGLPDQMVQLAEHIVDAMMSNFDPAYLEDRYRTVMLAMLRDKHVEIPKRPDAPMSANVIDLMDILKRSLSAQRQSTVGLGHKLRPQRAAAVSKRASFKRSKSRGHR